MEALYDGAIIKLLNPLRIRRLSYGEVSIPKTLDAATGEPVPYGLFCQRIFGPVRDYTCRCGRFLNDKKDKGSICPKCGVEITRSSVRRQRLGHISLAVPVVHPWYRTIIALLLNIPSRELDQIIMYRQYVVLKQGDSDYKMLSTISPADCFEATQHHGFRAETGGKAVRLLLERLDIEAVYHKLREMPPSRRVSRRLRFITYIKESDNKPAWMTMDCVPVLPAGLRPILALDDGSVVSSDLNELYVRLIHRNNRLKRLQAVMAPQVIINNEKAGIQAAIDALYDNERKTRLKDRSGKRILKSFYAFMNGKRGRMRGNLLGKRVDFSGRSQITAGPELKLHQCGLPYRLVIDMARPFIYNELMRLGYASGLKHARLYVDEDRPEVYEAIERVLSERVVLLNRAPSLHRMSFQAFDPVLINGRAIRLHPLVCSGFNADFDGDQMGVHLPLTNEAQLEARVLMSSIYNILSPAHGNSLVSPSQDMLLGIYYLTKERSGCPGEGKIFSDAEDALTAYYHGIITEHSKIRVRYDGDRIDTTAGRLLFSQILPPQISLNEVNRTIKKKDLGMIIEMVYERAGHRETVRLVDEIKNLGFKYATLSGISLCIDDLTIPKEKQEIITQAEKETGEINNEYDRALIEEKELYNKTVKIWEKATASVAGKMMEELEKDMEGFNSVYMMADSGARGSVEQLKQAGGMRGLMAKTTGEIVAIPIKSNFREGLTYHEMLLASHGARKGRADGALKTAAAGYFTKKLIYALHDVIIHTTDCKTTCFTETSALMDGETEIIPLQERLFGKTAASDIIDPSSGEIIAKKNEILSKDMALRIKNAGILSVKTRSALTCEANKGVCALCYGMDLAMRDMAKTGDAVGLIAAQSIGEPGTQLTLRTFHSGGSAKISARRASIETREHGVLRYNGVRTVETKDGRHIVVSRNSSVSLLDGETEENLWGLPYGATINVSDGAAVEAGQTIAVWDPYNIPIISTTGGEAVFHDIISGITMKETVDGDTGLIKREITAITRSDIPKIRVNDKEFFLPKGAFLMIDNGRNVEAGEIIAKVPVEASKNLDMTGGMKKILLLLELQRPKSPALLAEIKGEVSIQTSRALKGKYLIEISGDSGARASYRVAADRPLAVYNGDFVNAGEVIVEGTIDPREILRLRGAERAARYIADEVQKIYREQGVSIHDKHFEILVRKMMGNVEITGSGSTSLVPGEIVSLQRFLAVNENAAGEKATARRILLGIKDVALKSESWISAASFQQTTSILTEAAIQSKMDTLQGIKENILLSNPMPVGTGHPAYQGMRIIRKRGRPRKNLPA